MSPAFTKDAFIQEQSWIEGFKRPFKTPGSNSYSNMNELEKPNRGTQSTNHAKRQACI